MIQESGNNLLSTNKKQSNIKMKYIARNKPSQGGEPLIFMFKSLKDTILIAEKPNIFFEASPQLVMTMDTLQTYHHKEIRLDHLLHNRVSTLLKISYGEKNKQTVIF